MSETTTEPQEPTTEPAPAEPVEPTEPTTEPTEPTEPTVEPVEPTEPTEPTEPAQPAESSGMMTEADVKKFQREVERLFKDTAARVGRIFGDESTNLIECPFCIETAPGFFWNPQVRPISEGQQVAARSILNIPVPTDYQESPVYRQCASCAGKGSVRTGSLVPNNETAMCPECKGKGFIFRGAELPPQNGHSETVYADATTGPTVYSERVPDLPTEDRPEAEALRREGWLVVAPMAPARPAS